MAAAEVREARGIPGTTLRTTWLCRDKPSMKDALRKAGVPTAASTAADSADGGPRVRPRDRLPADPQAPQRSRRAGHRTRRLDGRRCDRALGDFGGADSIAVEEFVEGHEGFYDTITVDGHVVHDWVTHYYPNVLEAMRHRWISPAVHHHQPDRRTRSFYDEVRAMGHRVIEALGISTSATHMEWFYGPKGLRFSEIGCRPPGVGRLGPLLRRQRRRRLPRVGPRHRARRRRRTRCPASTPPASSRCGPTRTARSSGYSGLDEINGRYGQWIIDAHLPDTGTRAPSRSRPATWPTPGSGCATPTTTPLRGDARRRRTHRAGARRMTGRDEDDPPRAPALPARPRAPWCARVAPEGPVATVTAGWQDRESDDRELDEVLDGRSRNLGLFGRLTDVLDTDDRFAAAALAHRDAMDELAGIYSLRLQRALDSVYAVAAPHRPRRHRRRRRSPTAVRAVCATSTHWYLGRRRPALRRARGGAAPPESSEPIARHRAEVAELLARRGRRGDRRGSRRHAAALPAAVRGRARAASCPSSPGRPGRWR